MNSYVRCGQSRARAAVDRVVGEELLVLVDHHVAARAGWDDDRIGTGGQHVDRVPRERAGVVDATGVERRLAAARLRRRTVDVDAQPLEHVDHRHARVGEQAVDQTGHEQLDTPGRRNR